MNDVIDEYKVINNEKENQFEIFLFKDETLAKNERIKNEEIDNFMGFLFENKSLTNDDFKNLIFSHLDNCNNPEKFIDDIYKSSLRPNEKNHMINRFIERSSQIDTKNESEGMKIVLFIEALQESLEKAFPQNFQEIYKDLILSCIGRSSIDRNIEAIPEIFKVANKSFYDDSEYEDLLSKSFFGMGNNRKELLESFSLLNPSERKEKETSYNLSFNNLLENVNIDRITTKKMISLGNNLHIAVTPDFVDKIDKQIINIFEQNLEKFNVTEVSKAFKDIGQEQMSPSYVRLINTSMIKTLKNEELYNISNNKKSGNGLEC